MDGQYGFAARDEIWRILEELNKLQASQLEQAERIGQLERRRNDDSKLKSLWGPLSPLPVPAGGSIQTEPIFHSPPDAFKGFDQGHHPLGMANSTIGIDPDEEPRRGASRANSVRFDESAIHGYYGQNSRSSTDLPLRTGSGMGSLPLSERSSSHRSDGRLSSSGHSHHSVRTNSLHLDTASRGLESSFSVSSPITPPPGLFLLGPVPCIIRCWLTTNFSHETILYAAICSGSYVSTLSTALIRKLGMEELAYDEGSKKYVKIPVHLTEASVRQASSLSASPEPQVPTLTVRFLVREADAVDDTVGIIIGSDVLQSHSADILLSKNRVVMMDDEHNHVSIPLVRPEKESVFKSLCTGPSDINDQQTACPSANVKNDVGVIGPPNGLTQPKHETTSAPDSTGGAVHEEGDFKKSDSENQIPATTEALSANGPSNGTDTTPSKPGTASVWGSQRSKLSATAAPYKVPSRPMKVLRPMKPSSRPTTSAGTTPTYPTFPTPPPLGPSSHYASHAVPIQAPQGASNPVGGASAFQWLKPASGASVGNSK